jgi:hypothetical protein
VSRAALSDDDLVAIRQSPGRSHGLRMPQASGHDGTRLQSGIIPIPDPRFAGDRGSIPIPIPDLPGMGGPSPSPSPICRGSGIIPIPGSHRGFRALVTGTARVEHAALRLSSYDD